MKKITSSETAEILGISKRTLWRWVKRGVLKIDEEKTIKKNGLVFKECYFNVNQVYKIDRERYARY